MKSRLTFIDKFGPWAIVTGASSGIGQEFARQLASSGLNLVLVARRLALLEEVGQTLAREFGIQYRAVEADLAEERSIAKIAEATDDLDIGLLISNAGTGIVGNFLSFEEEELKHIQQLNAISHLRLTHYFGRRLAKRGKGGVVLGSAMGASDGIPYSAAAAATKALVLSLGKGLHTEFKELGLNMTVLVVSPTDTAMIAKLGFTKDDMPMKPISVKQCVEETLAALSANRMTIMPGRIYRAMNALVPGSIARQMTGQLMKKSNAFFK